MRSGGDAVNVAGSEGGMTEVRHRSRSRMTVVCRISRRRCTGPTPPGSSREPSTRVHGEFPVGSRRGQRGDARRPYRSRVARFRPGGCGPGGVAMYLVAEPLPEDPRVVAFEVMQHLSAIDLRGVVVPR